MAKASRRQANPIDVATQRLLALVARGVPPSRMARELEVIIGEWRGDDTEADPYALRERLDELFSLLDAGVADAEEQVADTQGEEPAMVKQAGQTLAALVATRDAAARARLGL